MNLPRADSAKADGQRIVRLRQEHGWTRQELAQQSGVPISTVGRAEKGRNIRVQNLDELAEALGVKLAEIMVIESAPAVREPRALPLPASSQEPPTNFEPSMPASEGPRIYLAALPPTGSVFRGRKEEMVALSALWNDPRTNVVTVIASGGTGKTALLTRWLARMHTDGYRGARSIFGWSFNGQGGSEEGAGSSDAFLSKALRWFGDQDSEHGSSWDKGERLAQLVRKERTLLILDGLEPLQYPPGPREGDIRDPGIKSLLRGLAFDNRGLCVVSTFIPIADLEDLEGATVHRLQLAALTPERGAELLEVHGVRGEQHELENVSRNLGGHALALTLMGNYLRILHGGDVRYHHEVKEIRVASKLEDHALRVVKAYERHFAGTRPQGWLSLRRSADAPELELSRIIGLFDGPADWDAIEAVRRPPAIKGLTATICALEDARFRFALQNLKECGLSYCQMSLMAS
jgi:transcriptional regulator with XRE-family HTH domain